MMNERRAKHDALNFSEAIAVIYFMNNNAFNEVKEVFINEVSISEVFISKGTMNFTKCGSPL